MGLYVRMIVEFFGTFILLSIIMTCSETDNDLGPLYISGGLFGALIFGGNISGGHFNPAVSIMFFMKDYTIWRETIGYICAQIVGASGAYYWNKLTIRPLTL